MTTTEEIDEEEMSDAELLLYFTARIEQWREKAFKYDRAVRLWPHIATLQ